MGSNRPARAGPPYTKASAGRRGARRNALLAENLGKPSLWVIINAPWYNAYFAHPEFGLGEALAEDALWPEMLVRLIVAPGL